MAHSTQDGSDCLHSDFEEYVDQNGTENLGKFVLKKLQELESVSVKIAVTGMSGSGKSTFINTFRGLTAEDDGAAASGVNETTEVPKEYCHPRNKNIALWDLPGIGTTAFNQDNYIQKVQFKSYDFFLILTRKRVFEDDIWLAKEAQKEKKKYFIARTHTDADISNDRKAKPTSHNEQRLLKDIRDNVKRQLDENDICPEEGVYLISTFPEHVDDWDYRRLEQDMLHKLPRIKREVLLLNLNNFSEDLIKEKCKVLRSYRLYYAIVVAYKGFKSVEDLHDMPSEVEDYLNELIQEFRAMLGLDIESLKRLSRKTGVDLEKLMSKVTKEFNIPFHTIRYPLQIVISMILKYIPIPKQFATLGTAFVDSYFLMHAILQNLESASLCIIRTATGASQ